ncbi:hypothetical protein V5O48_015422 [Marasmius crinis-equi]|uniref:Zn(2)-C6 fungal-type domain-containing protein n=1 Tax=Marasmius crinis-equi TaxID=585013 RepID=A0ABR3EUM6_9AGAR
MSYTRQELPSELASPEPFSFIPLAFPEPKVEADEPLPPQPTDVTEEENDAWEDEQVKIGERNGQRSQAWVEQSKRKFAHEKSERTREREEKKEWEKREEERKKKVEEWNASEDRKAKEWEEEERQKAAEAEKRKTEEAERERAKSEAARPKGKEKASEGATDPEEPKTTEPDGEEELDGKRVYRMPEDETGDRKPGLAEMYEQGKKDGEIIGFELGLAAGASGKKARGGGGGQSKNKFSEGARASVACKRCEDANKICYLAIPTAESTTSACCLCANSKQRCSWSAVPPAASDAGASNSALVGLMGEMVREMRKTRRGMEFYYGTKSSGEPSDAEEDDEDEEEGEVKIPAPGKPSDSPRQTVKRLIPYVEIAKSPVTRQTAAAKRKAGEDEGEAGQPGPSEQPKMKKKVNLKSTETVESEPEERGEVDKSKEKSKKGGK